MDLTCTELVQGIDTNCHALVLTLAIWGKYSTQIRTLLRQRVPLWPISVMRILMSIWANADKDTRLLPDDRLGEVKDLEPEVKPDDRVFVRAASSVPNSILATTDEPLREAVRSKRLDRDHGFTVCAPVDALLLAERA